MDEFKQSIGDILSMTDNKKTREKVSIFLIEDVKEYSEKLIKLEQDIESGSISLSNAGKIFSSLTSGITKKAEELEEEINGLILRNVKEAFRQTLINGPVYKSLIVKRGLDKPRGYPGDCQIIETFYDNKPISNGIGSCSDKYFLKEGYVRAVRDRKNDMRELLDNFIKNSRLTSINILNLGCGSCREIRELFSKPYKTKKRINFTLVDQDKEALHFSENEFKSIAEYLPKNIKFTFVKEDIYNLIGSKKNKKIMKNYSLIYSIGLADYLPDMYLGRLIKSCYELLDSKGTLIIAHKQVKTYKATAPDWFGDWHFFPRNRQDLNEIIETYLDANKFKMEFKDGKSKRIFFLVIKK